MAKVRALEPRKKISPLDTPTDLKPDGVAAVSQALNALLADTFALYLKTKNFHWHMSGPHFRDYHLLLDEQADADLRETDDIAERVRKIGGTTLRSIGAHRHGCSASRTTTRTSSRPATCCAS